MSIYYDETIFTDARTFRKYSEVNVFNLADKYLFARANIQTYSTCETGGDDDNGEQCTLKSGMVNSIVNVNPRRPCRGINIYTLNINNKKIAQTEPFNQITVFQGESVEPLTLDEYVPQTVYTVGRLTPLESAIIIKYYAINNAGVLITRHLFGLIKEYFNDQRSWFTYQDIGIVQNAKKELVRNMDYLNLPILTISGPELLLQ